MAVYTFADKPLNNELFRDQLTALGLPGGATLSRPETETPGTYEVRVTTGQDISGAEQAALAALVTSHDHTQRTAAQAASDQASIDRATAINLNPPITDLEAARDALAAARTALVAAVSTYNSGDTQIQAMGASPSAAALATALKGLSANNRAFIAAQIDADQAIVDGLQALETSIKRLRTRFA